MSDTHKTDSETRARLNTAVGELESLRREIGVIEKKELSATSFAERFLPFSAATYNRLQTPEKYEAKLDSVLLKCEEATNRIRARLDALRRRNEAESGFIKTRFALAALGAWQRAQDDEGTRVIVLLGPTGSGKSEIGRHMAARLGAVTVEGRQSWQSSYKAPGRGAEPVEGGVERGEGGDERGGACGGAADEAGVGEVGHKGKFL